MSATESVRFVCTGVGRGPKPHPSRQLRVVARASTVGAELELLDDDVPPDLAALAAESSALVEIQPARRRGGVVPLELMANSPAAVHTEGQSWSFRCPTCRLHLQLAQPDVLRLVDELLARGQRTCDISDPRC